MAASILWGAGLHELVARDLAEYEALVRLLVKRRRTRERLRTKVVQHRRRPPCATSAPPQGLSGPHHLRCGRGLFDTRAWVQAFETGALAAWEGFVAGDEQRQRGSGKRFAVIVSGHQRRNGVTAETPSNSLPPREEGLEAQA
jgi:hypothetical protein